MPDGSAARKPKLTARQRPRASPGGGGDPAVVGVGGGLPSSLPVLSASQRWAQKVVLVTRAELTLVVSRLGEMLFSGMKGAGWRGGWGLGGEERRTAPLSVGMPTKNQGCFSAGNLDCRFQKWLAGRTRGSRKPGPRGEVLGSRTPSHSGQSLLRTSVDRGGEVPERQAQRPRG